MSHIDEALTRAMAGPRDDDPRTSRLPVPSASPWEFNLDQFPREDGGSALRGSGGSAGRGHQTRRAEMVVSPLRRAADADGGRERSPEGSPQGRGDQYTRLAAALNEAQARLGLKTLMVTSTQAGEGKTATVVRLAHILGDTYARRVLVIDANLRWPCLHEALGVRNDVGLSEALGPRASVRLPLIEVSPLLQLLSGGQPEADPLPALASDRMRAVLDQCADQFDWVLLDTPALSALPDVQVLVRRTHGVVFVIGAASVPFPAVERAIAALGRESIIGTVLNGVNQAAATVLDSLHVKADAATAQPRDRTLSGIY